MGDRAVVASLGDCLVRQADIELLAPGQWLNDQIIGFFFELCENETFAGSNIAFVGPEVAQFMRVAAEGEVAACLEPLGLAARAAVLLAVNNCQDPTRPGGSHWSLLVFVRKDNAFYHLDSSGDMNALAARELAARVGRVAGGGGTVTTVAVAQQGNGSDCGVHCLLHAERVARHLAAGGDMAGLDAGTGEMFANGREAIADIIRKVGRRE
jgi:sentrin-specific protease 8